MHFYYTSVFSGFIDVYPNYLKALPIPVAVSTEVEQLIVQKVDLLLAAHQNLHKTNNIFFKRLSQYFKLAKPTEKLATWYEMEWADFIKELKKAKVKVAVKQEVELLEIFETHQQEAQSCLLQIDHLDRLIDQQIYALYDLTKEEIRIVENG
jgi:predicted TIM-barrel fold metal-dependent hydrolase